MSNWLREIKDYARLILESETQPLPLVFYSERDTYYEYFEPFLSALAAGGGPSIHYLTSDPKDRLLAGDRPGLKAYYVNRSLATVMARLKARVVVMTMPDLDLFHIKRSPNVAHYVYAFHAISSAHVGYREHAFDAYDVMLCIGRNQVDELLALEAHYQLKPKRLVECGYPRLEAILGRYQAKPDGGPQKAMLASSWGPNSILGRYGVKVVEALAESALPCAIRPHPEYIKRQPEQLAELQRAVQKHAQLSVDLSPQADFGTVHPLICDSSGIGLEYTFGTERPVVRMDESDVPPRLENPQFQTIGLAVLDLDAVLKFPIIKFDQLRQLPAVVAQLESDRAAWTDKIRACRDRAIFNWGQSARVGAEVLMELVQA